MPLSTMETSICIQDWTRNDIQGKYTFNAYIFILCCISYMQFKYILCYNIFQSLKRFVYQKNEEIAVLKALGTAPRIIRAIFIFEGFIISILGILIGLSLGLFISNNIAEVFSFIELICNKIIIPFSQDTVTSP